MTKIIQTFVYWGVVALKNVGSTVDFSNGINGVRHCMAECFRLEFYFVCSNIIQFKSVPNDTDKTKDSIFLRCKEIKKNSWDAKKVNFYRDHKEVNLSLNTLQSWPD